MAIPPRLGLSEAEKDALLEQQQEMIERLVSRISELEALVGKPRKTSSNSHIPPSKDGFGKKKSRKRSRGKRPSREGKARPLAQTPDKTERVVAASDETTTRTNGVTQWQWVFISDQAVLHKIAPRRTRSVAEEVLGDHQPKLWVSDRYAGQQELGKEHQVCLAHVLRDVQYAIDCGDTIFAPKIRDHLRWAIRVGKRRHELKDTTLATYAAKADHKLTQLMRAPVAHPAGKTLLKQIKAWRAKFFVFLTNRSVPATNNISEREIRSSVVFRKVTNGFRSDWGAQIHAGYRSITGTARLNGKSALAAIRELVDGTFAVA